MTKIRIIAENPPVSQSYLKKAISRLRKVYPYKVSYEFCQSISDLRVEIAPNEKIVFFTNSNITQKLFPIRFDGIGLNDQNIAIIKYQKNSRRHCYCLNRKLIAGGMKNTLLLQLHELGHLMGLNHCKNRKCVMAKVECNNESEYCWRCLAGYKKIDASIFCLECKNQLFH